MITAEIESLRAIKTFPSLVKYLRDELDWQIDSDDFDALTFDYEPEELGLDAKTAVKVKDIKQLRPLVTNQPWGIFFINFEPKRLPVVVLRRILRSLVIKKRQSANKAQHASWQLHDLLFISSYGESDHRDITFAHFSEEKEMGDLPTLRVLGWDDEDTALHLGHTHKILKEKLRWPENEKDFDAWRESWASAFTLRHREVITTSKALAVSLAELATAIRKRVNRVLTVESDTGALRKLMAAFREALIHNLSEDDFADMYAQTITYGLLTARVSRRAGLVADNVADMVLVTNPFLREMLSTFLTVGGRKGKIDFDEVGINDVVQALRAANMEAVLRDFGDKNPQEDPVVHFYELFLKEYDPKKRVQRGVFYTPRPVVSYIVRSVHELLQTEFGLEDGLASTVTWGDMAAKDASLKIPDGVNPAEPFVQILDPATGTATFLVEVIDLIYGTRAARWKQQHLTEVQQRAAWNEYVPKHLLPRLHGFELMMAPYAIAHMKIGLKLYETGYRFGSDERARIYLTNSLEPASDDNRQRVFEEWAPALAHEAQAVNAVKRKHHFTVVIGNPPYSVSSQNNGEWIRGLCEDFKRGLEGERNVQPLSDDYIKFLRLAVFCIERAGSGLIGMITNREYVQGVIHRATRKRLLDNASRIAICDLHGQRGELFDGQHVADENVFEIEKGVAISVLCFPRSSQRHLAYGEMIGSATSKSEMLLRSVSSTICTSRLTPEATYWFFKPWKTDFKEEYLSMPSLIEFFSRKPVTGFATHRDDFAIGFAKSEVVERLGRFLDVKVSDAQVRADLGLNDTRDWHLREARVAARRDARLHDRITICSYRPFDWRWVIYSDDILEYSRRDAMQYISREAPALICSRLVKDEVYAHVFISKYPVEKIFLSPKSSNNAQICISGFVSEAGTSLVGSRRTMVLPRNAPPAYRHVALEDVLRYLYAILHSPTYRRRYAEFLKNDFPHLPLAQNLDLFRVLARLGGELAALHLFESPKLEKPFTTYIGCTNPEVEKAGHFGDTVWLDKARTCGFRGVPEAVWNFHIGGYRVCEKWLKDRRGHNLSKGDIEHYHRIVVALSETIRLMAEIDKVIDAHGGWPAAFRASSGSIQG